MFLKKNVSLLNLIWVLTLSLLLKLPPRKLNPWFFSMKSFSSEIALYLNKSTIRLRNYVNVSAKLLVLHFLAPFNPWLIVKIQAYYRSPPLQNYNFSKCVNWGTGQERFCFMEKLLFVLKIFTYLYLYPMIYQICDVAMSISTWGRVRFWTSFEPQLIVTKLGMDRYKQGQ